VAPYSVRPRPGAPGRLPFGWKNWMTGRRARWTLRTVLRRLDTDGDPWAGINRPAVALGEARGRLEEARAETVVGGPQCPGAQVWLHAPERLTNDLTGNRSVMTEEDEPETDQPPAPEDQPEEPGAEGGSSSQSTERLPAMPAPEDDSPLGDTDQHSTG
jgi:hypothetical protein